MVLLSNTAVTTLMCNVLTIYLIISLKSILGVTPTCLIPLAEMKQLVQRNPSFEPGWRVYYFCKDAALAYTLKSYYLCHSSPLIVQAHLDILYL